MGNGNAEKPGAKEGRQTEKAKPGSADSALKDTLKKGGDLVKTDKKKAEAPVDPFKQRMRSLFDNFMESINNNDFENAIGTYEIIMKHRNFDVDNICEKATEWLSLIKNMINGLMILSHEVDLKRGVTPLPYPIPQSLPYFNNALKSGIRLLKLMENAPANAKQKSMQLALSLISKIENRDTGFSDFLKNAESGQTQKKPKSPTNEPAYPPSPKFASFFSPSAVSPSLQMRSKPKAAESSELQMSDEDKKNISEYLSLKAELFGSIYPKRKSSVWQMIKASQNPGEADAMAKTEKKPVAVHEDEREMFGLKAPDPSDALDRLITLTSPKFEDYKLDEPNDPEGNKLRAEARKKAVKLADDANPDATKKEREEARKTAIEISKDPKGYELKRKVCETAIVLSAIFQRLKNKDPYIIPSRWTLDLTVDTKGNPNFVFGGPDNIMHEWMTGKKFIEEKDLIKNINKLLKELKNQMAELRKHINEKDRDELNEVLGKIKNPASDQLKEETRKFNNSSKKREFIAIQDDITDLKSAENIKFLIEQLNHTQKWDKAKKGEDSIDPEVELVIYKISIDLYLNAIKQNPSSKDKYEALFRFLDKIGFGKEYTDSFRNEFEKINKTQDYDEKNKNFADLYTSIKTRIDTKLKTAKLLPTQKRIGALEDIFTRNVPNPKFDDRAYRSSQVPEERSPSQPKF